MYFYLKKYRSRVGNARKSLEQPVIIQTLLGNIKNYSSKGKAEPLKSFNSLHFWDLGKKASKEIKVGDIIYIVMQDDVYWGRIVVHIYDRDGGIGDAIGWSRQFESPWVNPIGIQGIKKIELTPNINNILEKSIRSDNEITKSFYRLMHEIDFKIKSTNHNNELHTLTDDTERSKYHNKEVISTVTQSAGSVIENRDDNLVYETSLHNLQSRLKLLKEASHHSEREHESLVEKFFEYLGYEYPTDIKYRVGYADMLINGGSQDSFVVEVKREWNLNRNSMDAINQAFLYANKCGARFVVITNGDYYAFWDRLRGLSISDNFDFDFYLSKFRRRDLQLLQKIKKTSLL